MHGQGPSHGAVFRHMRVGLLRGKVVQIDPVRSHQLAYRLARVCRRAGRGELGRGGDDVQRIHVPVLELAAVDGVAPAFDAVEEAT